VALITNKRDGTNVIDLASLLVALGLTSSKSEARRAFEQGGVRRDGEVVAEAELQLDGEDAQDPALEALAGSVWQVGKRRFARVVELI
jgi:tyrosyl-tRNA synthetase